MVRVILFKDVLVVLGKVVNLRRVVGGPHGTECKRLPGVLPRKGHLHAWACKPRAKRK